MEEANHLSLTMSFRMPVKCSKFYFVGAEYRDLKWGSLAMVGLVLR